MPNEEESNLPPAPSTIAELADACVRFVKQTVGVELDYTPDTLSILDHYLMTNVGDTPDDATFLAVLAAGAYWGEVIRRHWPSVRWHAPENEPGEWRLEFDRVFLHFNPVAMAVEAAARVEGQDGWDASFHVLDQDRKVLDESLAATEPVSEEDYFRLAVRFDTLEHAVDVLVACADARGESTRTFGADVYAAALGGENPGLAH